MSLNGMIRLLLALSIAFQAITVVHGGATILRCVALAALAFTLGANLARPLVARVAQPRRRS
jgi:hypothetical protein